jgi:hypothetical protein
MGHMQPEAGRYKHPTVLIISKIQWVVKIPWRLDFLRVNQSTINSLLGEP